MADATGETKQPLRVAFDRRLKLEFHGARITSDAGLLAYRELDDALGLTTMAVSALAEGRRGKNIRHRLLGLLRQAIYGRLAGYEDVNDAERLARDPAMRAIVGREGLDRLAASTSQMGRFETEWLATEANLAALADLSGAWIDRVHRRRPPDGIILDMDSSESPRARRGRGVQEANSKARPGTGLLRCTHCYSMIPVLRFCFLIPSRDDRVVACPAPGLPAQHCRIAPLGSGAYRPGTRDPPRFPSLTRGLGASSCLRPFPPDPPLRIFRSCLSFPLGHIAAVFIAQCAPARSYERLAMPLFRAMRLLCPIFFRSADAQ
jgi:hypothetical protein